MIIARTLIEETYQQFNLPNHNFNQHVRFTLIEHLDNVKIDKDFEHLQFKETCRLLETKILHSYGLMLTLIFPISNQISSYLLFWYIFNNIIFSADWLLPSLDIDFKCMTSCLKSNATYTNFKQSPEDSLSDETSWGNSVFL